MRPLLSRREGMTGGEAGMGLRRLVSFQFSDLISQFAAAGALIIICVCLSIASPFFLTLYNEDTGVTILTKANLNDPKVQAVLNPSCQNPPL